MAKICNTITISFKQTPEETQLKHEILSESRLLGVSGWIKMACQEKLDRDYLHAYNHQSNNNNHQQSNNHDNRTINDSINNQMQLDKQESINNQPVFPKFNPL